MARISVTRRRFALGAAAAATTALINPAQALEQAQSTTPLQPSNVEEKARAAMAKLSPAAQAEVEMKVASIFRKYGNMLNDEQKADIRRAMAEAQDGVEKMRAFALENGDQPATVLKLRREGGKR
ncbi:MAG TPA: hypothetical protein VFW31_10700 [Candidatus Angelobacter sp.]|nr:hypothetical protein [Candidatus Angelobacter sp.]